MENKYLTVKEEGFFQKIKSFFMKLFGKNKVIEEPVVENIVSDNVENKKTFAEEIRVKQDDEKLSTLKLQKDYEAGLIKEEDMTQEQVSKVENLYVEQITKLRKDYNGYKQKITDVRKKLAHNN